jgi:hypothetical protein
MSRDKARTPEDWDDDKYAQYDDEYAPDASYYPAQRRRRPQYRQQRRRSVWPWLLLGCAGGVILIVLTAVIIVLVAVRTATNGGSIPTLPGIPNQTTFSKSSQQTLQITSLTQLQIHNQIGNVTITADPNATAAIITTTKHVKAATSDDANKEFNNISVQVQAPTASNSTLGVTATVPDTGSLFGNHNDSVDLNIALPTSAIASAPTAIPATTPTATTSSQQGTPFTLNVDNSIGDVTVSGFKGILLLKDDIGNIAVDHATLFDTSHLLTGTGKVTFNGGLDTTPLGSDTKPRYKLQSETGTIDATLPGDTNIILDANTNAGKITSDFPINVTTSDQSANFYGPLNTNSSSGSPVAVFSLSVSTGNVIIHRA